MNKKIIFIILIAILIIAGGLGIFSFLTRQVEVDEEGGVRTTQDSVVVQETSYEKDGNTFNFSKNRVTKTAELEVIYGIADDEEFIDLFGEEVTGTPFMVNLLCSTTNTAAFDPEELEDLTDEEQEQAESIVEDEQFESTLEGYTISKFRYEFIDKESRDPIASCESTEKGFENIVFDVQRDYSEYSSLFGHQIGVIPEDEE